MVNGVAFANRDKTVFCLGSDGSQQEGNDAEAARLAVAQRLNVKLLIDDNNVTIAGTFRVSQRLRAAQDARLPRARGHYRSRRRRRRTLGCIL
jgi:transketolase